MVVTDAQLVKRYRKRWDQIDRLIALIRECPLCGNSGRPPSRHADGCVLAPVETCRKRLIDEIFGNTYLCRLRAGHKGTCN